VGNVALIQKKPLFNFQGGRMRSKFKVRFPGSLLKVIFLSAGGFLIFRNREKIKSLAHNSGFIVTAIHGILLSLIALVYRLIVSLNWIIQQSR